MKSILITLALLFCNYTFSQDSLLFLKKDTVSRLQIGLSGSLNRSLVTVQDRNTGDLHSENAELSNSFNTTDKNGYTLGLLAEYKYNQRISFRFTPGIGVYNYHLTFDTLVLEKTTLSKRIALIELPFHVILQFPPLKNFPQVLAGVNYMIGNKNTVPLANQLSTLALDGGLQFSKKINDLIIGIELRYTQMLNNLTVMRFNEVSNLTDKIHLNNIRIGLTFKY